MHCLPKYLPIEAEAAVHRLNEKEAEDGIVGGRWVSEHCSRCGYEHLARRPVTATAERPAGPAQSGRSEP